MIPEEAIKKAIEGGWLQGDLGYQYEGYNPISPAEVYFQSFVGAELHDHTLRLSDVALDPSFWRALGKALGWSEAECLGIDADLTCPCKPRTEVLNGQMLTIHNGSPRWSTEAHNFYGLILTREDTDSFWKQVLKKIE